MSELTIRCPHCKTDFALSEAVKSQVSEGIIREQRDQLAERERELSRKSDSLEKEKLDYQKKMKQFEARIAEVVKEKERVALEHAEERVAQKVESLESQVNELKEAKKAAEAAELAIRRKEVSIQEKEQNLELEILRRTSGERERLQGELRATLGEEYRLQLAESNKKLAAVEQQLETARIRLSQGSQQLQGEVLEIDLETALRQRFPLDTIEEVPKGFQGADILHRVNDHLGRVCGTIVWETKRTKTWNDEWITKLKDDLTQAKGDFGVIATVALPEGISGFANVGGIWVTTIPLSLEVANALRETILMISSVRRASIGKNEKVELVHEYLTGPEFKRRVETLVEAWMSMKSQLETEKRAFQRQWAEREKQLERVLRSTAAMYGEMRGIMGSSMSDIAQLGLGDGGQVGGVLPEVTDESLSDENRS